MNLDVRWDIGVVGWKHNGRHYRLAEVLALCEDRDAVLRRHLFATLLLALVLMKLRGELAEAVG